MSRFASIFAAIIGSLIALLVIAAIAIFLFFDPNDFREEIAQAVKQETGRDLVIDGEVRLRLFPWLAITVGHTKLGNAEGFGDAAFAEFDRAELSVRVLPLLLHREVAVGAAELDALHLNLAVDRNGRSNWADFVSTNDATGDPDGAGSGVAELDGQTLEISGIDLNDATVVYADQASGAVYSLRDLNMTVGRIAGTADPGVVRIDGLAIDGVVEGLASSATRLGVRTAGIELNTRDQAVQLEPLEIRALDIEMSASVPPFSYAGAIETTAAIKVAAFSPRSLMHLFDVSPPATADPSVLSRLAIEAQADIRESYASLSDISIKLDDTTFTGGLTVPYDVSERFLLDLSADSIDLDRYMAPPGEGDAGEAGESAPVEIPVDLITPLNARGSLTVGRVLVGGLELKQLALTLQASDGRLRMHPMSATLFGGSYSGDISIDVSGSTPVLSMNESVDGVDLAKLALAMFDQDNITGAMSGSFKLSGRGKDMLAVQRTLNGKLAFELKDGTYEGTDVWYELRRARALLRKETPPEPALPARTPFTSVTATGVVVDGIMSNEDFVADLPFMQLTGNGAVNLPAGSVDYALKARVFAKPEAMQGASPEEIEDLTKTVIPLRISGPVAAPKIRPDVEELLRQRVEEEVKEKLQDKLEDLFRR